MYNYIYIQFKMGFVYTLLKVFKDSLHLFDQKYIKTVILWNIVAI